MPVFVYGVCGWRWRVYSSGTGPALRPPYYLPRRSHKRKDEDAVIAAWRIFGSVNGRFGSKGLRRLFRVGSTFEARASKYLVWESRVVVLPSGRKVRHTMTSVLPVERKRKGSGSSISTVPPVPSVRAQKYGCGVQSLSQPNVGITGVCPAPIRPSRHKRILRPAANSGWKGP